MSTLTTPHAHDYARAHRALVDAVDELPLALSHILLSILRGLDIARVTLDAVPVLFPDIDPESDDLRMAFRETGLTIAFRAYLRALSMIDDGFPDEVGDLTAPRVV